jgi:hypothetical protein
MKKGEKVSDSVPISAKIMSQIQDETRERKEKALWTEDLKALAEIVKLQQALIDNVAECEPLMERSLTFKGRLGLHPAHTLK